jgi:hypothetical protein
MSDQAILDAIIEGNANNHEEKLKTQAPIEQVNVGIFGVPGLKLVAEFVPDEFHDTMKTWATNNECGDCYDKTLWYFRDEAERTRFLETFEDAIDSQAAQFKG